MSWGIRAWLCGVYGVKSVQGAGSSHTTRTAHTILKHRIAYDAFMFQTCVGRTRSKGSLLPLLRNAVPPRVCAHFFSVIHQSSGGRGVTNCFSARNAAFLSPYPIRISRIAFATKQPKILFSLRSFWESGCI